MPSATIPAPLGGWNTLDPLAGMKLDYAPTLLNMLPRAGAVQVRSGFRTWASGMAGQVTGLFTHRSGGIARRFAACGDNIFDISGPGPVGAAVQTGLTNPYADGVMMNSVGGDYLLVFNGTDVPRQFDGTTWAVWAATGIPAGVSWACNHKGRLWVGNGREMAAWYGGPGAIGGAFAKYPIRSVARRGGTIIGMAAWTLDGGNGADDLAAFITSEGEVLIYSGLDPASPDTFALKGRFSVPRPIGRRCLRQAGADVLVLTEGGVFSLSSIVSGVEEAALAKKALTRRVEPSFLDFARSRGTVPGWDLAVLPSLGLWMVNIPWGSGNSQQIAFDGATGAAGLFIGLPARCWMDDGGQAFFGHASEGTVMLFGQDAADDGAIIQAEAVQAFSQFGSGGRLKRFTLAAPVLADIGSAEIRVDVLTDWQVPTPEAEMRGATAAPITAPAGRGGVWNISLWDVGVWGGPTPITRGWRAVRGIGQSGALRLRVYGAGGRPSWVATGMVYELGGPLR